MGENSQSVVKKHLLPRVTYHKKASAFRTEKAEGWRAYLSVERGKTRFPITQRQEVFWCSCCPPNITRLIASIGDVLYSYDDKTIFVNQFMQSETNLTDKIFISQETNYPIDGEIKIKASGVKGMKIAVRIPFWCDESSFSTEHTVIEKGYALFNCEEDDFELTANFEMKPMFYQANPNVQEDSGRVACMYGPVLYCAEAVDNGANLRDIILTENIKVKYDDEFGANVLNCKGFRRDPEEFSSLYMPVTDINYVDCDVKLIPYYSFANRGETEMIVWMLY